MQVKQSKNLYYAKSTWEKTLKSSLSIQQKYIIIGVIYVKNIG